jgi:hypothetical protein
MTGKDRAPFRKEKAILTTTWPSVCVVLCRTKNVVVPAVVEKCLSSTRAGTKAKALELILLYVEVDSADPVIVCSSFSLS